MTCVTVASVPMGVSESPLSRLLTQHVLVCDGAMGTMLHSAGVPLTRSLPELNVSRPSLVRDLHVAYGHAGAAILQTNTFGANRLRLAGTGLEDSVTELNIAGARLAREAAQQLDRPILVAGSVGPAAAVPVMPKIPVATRASALCEQVAALADWVDLLMLETFGDVDSLVQAVDVARGESDLPIIAQMTFGDDGRTLRGEDPADVAAIISALDVAALGANCTVGPAALQDVVTELARATHLPVSVQPNAGVPRRFGGQIHYARNAAYFAEAAPMFVENGAMILGGCCGTTPAHIRAIAGAVESLAPRSAAPATAPSGHRERREPVTLTAARQADPHAVAAPEPPADWPPDNGFVVAVGLQAPSGTDVPQFVGQARQLTRAGAGLLAITDPALLMSRVNPIAAAVVLRERVGTEVLLPVDTVDRNRAALQADLLGAHALGVRVVVCRTGGARAVGDYPQPGAPWDVDSIGLIAMLGGLNEGLDWRGIAAPERTRFVIGAAIATQVLDLEAELGRATEKAAAGAHFLVTDPIYDVEDAARLLRALRERGIHLPVIATLTPFLDVRSVERVAHEVPEIAIPGRVLADLRAARGDPTKAAQTAVETVEKLGHLISGVLVEVPSVSDERSTGLVERLVALGESR